jgi:hypothetical protein
MHPGWLCKGQYAISHCSPCCCASDHVQHLTQVCDNERHGNIAAHEHDGQQGGAPQWDGLYVPHSVQQVLQAVSRCMVVGSRVSTLMDALLWH